MHHFITCFWGSRKYCPGAIKLPGDELAFQNIIPTAEEAKAPGQ
jgi:hypothetical protein